ncbi:MAG TPA: cytochrome P450 [Gemmataceae bacterium]|nr:cytochrome P450 [Gemmataceae bacterium]
MLATAPSPPGPKGHFVSGNLPEFRENRLGFLTRCAREYGDFVSIRLGPRRVILVSDPEAIEYILATGSRHFSKHFALRMTPLILGKGLLTSEGDLWLRQRRLSQPAFNRNRIAAYAGTMVDYTEQMLAGWKDGETRDILREMGQLTLRITAKTLFDADAAGEALEVGRALRVAQSNFMARFDSVIPMPLGVPTPGNLRLRRAVRRLDNIIYRFIAERRATKVEKGDLLSLLLHARDEGDHTQMTDHQLRDEVMTLFLAGHETTALALSWTWALLAQNPQVQEKMLDEVQKVLDGRPATAADVPRLHYTEHVVTESLRLYPPAFIIGREAIADCEVGGYSIRPGMTLLMSQWVVHHDPRFFDNPDEFQPERWEQDRAKEIPKYAYFPFGGGPRRCIGEGFAMMEAVLIIATLAQKFRFTLQPHHPVVPAPNFTLRPRYGIKAVLENR